MLEDIVHARSSFGVDCVFVMLVAVLSVGLRMAARAFYGLGDGGGDGVKSKGEGDGLVGNGVSRVQVVMAGCVLVDVLEMGVNCFSAAFGSDALPLAVWRF